MVIYLASKASDYVHGTVQLVDGKWLLGKPQIAAGFGGRLETKTKIKALSAF
jgi:hypothetical protein